MHVNTCIYICASYNLMQANYIRLFLLASSELLQSIEVPGLKICIWDPGLFRNPFESMYVERIPTNHNFWISLLQVLHSALQLPASFKEPGSVKLVWGWFLAGCKSFRCCQEFGKSNCIQLSTVPVRIGLLQEWWKRKRNHRKRHGKNQCFHVFSFWFVGGRESQHCRRELHSASRGPTEEITRIKLERQNSLISFDQKITLVLSRTWFAFLPIHSTET